MVAHSHDEHKGHSHAATITAKNYRVFLIGICLNLGFVIAEAAAGLIYDSMALLTDAGHNLSDVAGLAVSLIAFRMARRKSSPSYTYGFKKATVLAALSNAVFLLIAIGILGYESAKRLFNPEPVAGDVIAWVAAIGILINGISAFLFFKRKQELNSRAAYLHLLVDALVSAGVVVAGIVVSKTGYFWIDPAIGLVIMIVILLSTWSLLRDSFKMSIDAVPAGIELTRISSIIASSPEVEQVNHVHVWAISTTENALTAHVRLHDALSFPERMAVIAKIRHELEHAGIHHSTIEMTDKAGSDCFSVNFEINAAHEP